MKKRWLVIFSLTLILFSYSVSAQVLGVDIGQGAATVIDVIVSAFGTVFAALLGGPYEFLFEKILLFFIILTFSYVSLTQFGPFKEGRMVGALWIVVLAVSLLATRFLSDYDIINNILLPYTTLGIVLTAGIPFIIFFFFVTSFESSTVRKMLWIFFIVVFVGLWYSRFYTVGQLSYIYFATAILALIFLLGDGTIRRYYARERWKMINANSNDQAMVNVANQLQTLNNIAGTLPPAKYREMKRRLENQLKMFSKN